jgi:hypothetical protein
MRAASSTLVVADSEAMKYRLDPYIDVVSVWCNTTFARLVFPIPPGPKIAILGLFRCKRPTSPATSGSLPWKIFGSDGSIERELELRKNIVIKTIRTIAERHTWYKNPNRHCSPMVF